MPRCTSLVVACLLLVGCTSADSISNADPATNGRSTTPTVVAPAEPALVAPIISSGGTRDTAPAEEIPSELLFADAAGGLYDE